MAVLLRSTRLLQRISAPNVASASYASHAAVEKFSPIGNREVVGFGCNGRENYIDHVNYPMPAIRYKAPTPEIQALREKEKGDWKKLSLEEKKQLYRASYCQTLSEIVAPTGEWKSIVGCSLALVSLAIWAYMGLKLFVYPELPKTLSLERQQAQLKRMIDIGVNPIEGISSKWDYEKGDWKK